MIAAAAAFAAAELLLVVAIGGFFGIGRAEALPFLLHRPWFLVAAASVAAAQPLRARLIFYGGALLLSVTAETFFVAALGAKQPVPEAVRGLVAGALLLAVTDIVVAVGRLLFGRRGSFGAALLMAAALLLPGTLRPYEAIILGPPYAAAHRNPPELMLMTALPIIWGEGGAFDPQSRPAASYRILQAEFRVRPLDVLDEAGLAGGALLLLAQPRALAPEELVAFDTWVRAGGRAVILSDPQLLWPTELPLGDIRRPPGIGLLDPLLTHWGLRLDPGDGRQIVVRDIGGRRLRMAAPGRFTATEPACVLSEAGLLARCRIGKGHAVLLADADLMHDGLWAGAEGGAERRRRTADNPLFVADQIDALAGYRRERLGVEVEWLAPGANAGLALPLAFLPLLLVLAAAASLTRLRRC